MSKICQVCGEGHIIKVTENETFEYKSAQLTAEKTIQFCDECGTLMQSVAIVRENARNIQQAKNKHDKLLTGTEIKKFRDFFELPQKIACQLFGGGPTAFSKYEADEISHNIAMDRLLRLCMASPANLAILAKLTEIELPSETKLAIHRSKRAPAIIFPEFFMERNSVSQSFAEKSKTNDDSYAFPQKAKAHQQTEIPDWSFVA